MLVAARLFGLLVVVVAGWFVGHNASQSGLAEMLARFWFVTATILSALVMFVGAEDGQDNMNRFDRPSQHLSFSRIALGLTGVAIASLVSHFALFVGILT